MAEERIFREKWLEAVDKKSSVLCAGLDPADYGMGRGEKGLPEESYKRDWTMSYIEAVAPHAAALKPNRKYWKMGRHEDIWGSLDQEILEAAVKRAKDLGMVVIEDDKYPDIGSTNDAGFYASQQLGVDAVTIAPYAGNMEEAVRQGHERGLGVITMCLMSNPEYAIEKNMLVPVDDTMPFANRDLVNVDGRGPYVPRYVYLAQQAQEHGIDGIVIGAPSYKNHIKDEEIRRVGGYVDDNMLVLLPGVGAQGGEAGMIWRHFGSRSVIVNVGRSLMFPNGNKSTPEEQAETARKYQEMLNELRTTA